MFGMFSGDDPVKSAYQMAGLQMLTSGDVNAALQNLPQMLLAAKKAKMEQDLEKRRLAISEANLDIDREKLKIYQSESTRAQKLQDDKEKMGMAWSKYDLEPNLSGNFPIGGMIAGGSGEKKDIRTSTDDWLGSEMSNIAAKGDAAMPLGEEGNEISKRIMALPLSMRQSMAGAPISAAELAAPAQTSALEAAFGKSGGDRAPQVKTFTNGEDTIILDLNDPVDYSQFQQLDPTEWTEAPQRTIEKAQANPNEYLKEPYKKQITAAQEDAATADAQLDDYSNLGSLLLRDDIYTGAGAGIVNNLLSSAQDVFGVFPEIDFSTRENADKTKREIVMNLRKSFPKDSQMSNADRQFFEGMVVGDDSKPETIARAIAIKQLAAEYKNAKAEFLVNAVEGGMPERTALKEWNKVAKKTRDSIANEENVKAVMGDLLRGANDDTLVEYIKKLKPGQAAVQAEESVLGTGAEPGSSPETAIPMRGPNDHKALPSGTYYEDPEGNIRQKQ